MPLHGVLSLEELVSQRPFIICQIYGTQMGKSISVAISITYKVVIMMWFLSHFDFNLFAVILPQVPFFFLIKLFFIWFLNSDWNSCYLRNQFLWKFVLIVIGDFKVSAAPASIGCTHFVFFSANLFNLSKYRNSFSAVLLQCLLAYIAADAI